MTSPPIEIFKHFRNDSVAESRIRRVHGRDLNGSGQRDLSVVSLPSFVDLTRSGRMPVIYDQGNIASCTSHAVGTCVQFLYPEFHPSRLFLYYNARLAYNQQLQDAGSSIYATVRQAAKLGIAEEAVWPYVTANNLVQPSDVAKQNALGYKMTDFAELEHSGNSFKNCLNSGYPFSIGFNVYPSTISSSVMQTGLIPIPLPTERSLGGHCVCICGYDDTTQLYKVHNSWGSGRGQKGYFYLPYAFLHNSNIAWNPTVIRKVTMPTPPPVTLPIPPLIPAPTPVPTPVPVAKLPPLISFLTTKTVTRLPYGKTNFTVKLTNNNDQSETIGTQVNVPAPIIGSMSSVNTIVGPRSTVTVYLSLNIPMMITNGQYPVSIEIKSLQTGLTNVVSTSVSVFEPTALNVAPVLTFDSDNLSMVSAGVSRFNVSIRNNNSYQEIATTEVNVPWPMSGQMLTVNSIVDSQSSVSNVLTLEIPTTINVGTYKIEIKIKSLHTGLSSSGSRTIIVM